MNDDTKQLLKPLTDQLQAEFEIKDIEENLDQEMPPSVKSHIRKRDLADGIAEGLSRSGLEIPEIDHIELMYGSGDTGRGTQVIFQPTQNTTKDGLRENGEKLAELLDAIFPTDYVLFINHQMTIDDGKPVETDEFYLELYYNVRSHGSPSPHISDRGEVISKG